jgi:hypothetical protein
MAVVVNPVVVGICRLPLPDTGLTIGGSSSRPAQSSAGATPTAYGDCGPGAQPETGLQGQVPAEDQASGRSRRGDRCNLQLVGQTDLRMRGANFQLAWYRDCAYVSVVGGSELQSASDDSTRGVGVVDASNPADPQLVQIVRSPVGDSEHEAIEVNQARGMMVVAVEGLAARYLEIYDVSRDCRQPVFKGRFDAGYPIYHGLRISDDGRTVYASDNFRSASGEVLHVLDVSDMSHPKLLKRWDPVQANPLEPYAIHDLDVSTDGNRAYLGATPPSDSVGIYLTGPPSNAGPSLVVLDTTDIQQRRFNPDLRPIGQIHLPNFGHSIQRATIDGKPYIFLGGETPVGGSKNCPWAWGHVIDMSDERNPREVSQIKLEVNEQENCSKIQTDDEVYSIHYVGVDDEQNTTKVFYTWYTGGVRVFDVRDPAHPKEIAYFHSPPKPSTVIQPSPLRAGDGQTPDWDSSTSMVHYRSADEIWVVSIAGGFQVLKLNAPRAGCVKVAGTVRGKSLGSTRLGRTRSRQRKLLQGRLLSRRGGIDRYCAEGGGSVRIGYPTRRLRRSHPSARRVRKARHRALIVLTSSRRVSARGLRVGSSTRVLRWHLRRERRVREGNSVWYLAPGKRARLVFKTRRGHVLQVGLANKNLTAGRRAAKSFLGAWHL